MRSLGIQDITVHVVPVCATQRERPTEAKVGNLAIDWPMLAAKIRFAVDAVAMARESGASAQWGLSLAPQPPNFSPRHRFAEPPGHMRRPEGACAACAPEEQHSNAFDKH
jgi:hypothetical protein